MDALPQLGRGVFEVLEQTFAAYESLLLAREGEIKSTRRETHQYGPNPRQALDVYYPTREAAAAATFRAARPVLVFCYGGGFVQGDKQKPEYANDLVFANLGHYFAARHGLTVVIPDYRLVSHGAQFPSGGEDLKLVVDWISTSLVRQEAWRDNGTGTGTGTDIDLFLMGNSVGGVHVMTWALHPSFADSVSAVTTATTAKTTTTVHEDEGGHRPAGVLLRGLLLLGAPFHFGGDDGEMLRAYYGAGDIANKVPLGLLEAAKQQHGSSTNRLLPGVGIAVLLSELDPEFIYQSSGDFEKAWPYPGTIDTRILKGHNHISPQVSLGTGVEREEAWGIQVVDFCRAHATS